MDSRYNKYIKAHIWNRYSISLFLSDLCNWKSHVTIFQIRLQTLMKLVGQAKYPSI
jgi:hypothetical protein